MTAHEALYWAVTLLVIAFWFGAGYYTAMRRAGNLYRCGWIDRGRNDFRERLEQHRSERLAEPPPNNAPPVDRWEPTTPHRHVKTEVFAAVSD